MKIQQNRIELVTRLETQRSRSLSLKPRFRGETFHAFDVESVSNNSAVGPVDKPFPPDKKSPMSPPETGCSGGPPKIQTLPYRCESVASTSTTGRSKFYASV